jgi:hypothetical protein
MWRSVLLGVVLAGVLAGKQLNYPHHTGTTFQVAPKAEEDEGPPQVEVLYEP